MVKEKKEKASDYYTKTISSINKLQKESKQRELEAREKGRTGKELGLPRGAYREKAISEVGKQAYYTAVKTSATISEVGGRAISNLLKKPLLKKPHAKVPVVSNKALMKSFARSGYTMFKSEGRDYSKPQEQPEQDNRSMFFKSEWEKEKRRLL
jgi:hypothetical protein